MIECKVCVVTVTYGDRWHLLSQVLERVMSFTQVANVVVVDNASIPPIISPDNKIIVLNNKENKGSAGGYHEGIKYAYEQTNCDFIWLLDDDNLPEPDCLDKLLINWDIFPGHNDRKALFCLRDDRKVHVKIARGDSPWRYYLVPDNFLGFNVFRIAYNQYHKLKDRFRKQTLYHKFCHMPYVPYGGLLLHRDTVAEIGYPNEAFYLYVDDSEYTYRIFLNDGGIWLVPDCRVIDIDQSQGINYKNRLFHSHLLDQWNFRTYYHIRNRVYFYSRVAIKNNFVFKINKVLYLAFLRVISVLSSKQTEYKKLVNAVNDGLKGNLGKATPDKF